MNSKLSCDNQNQKFDNHYITNECALKRIIKAVCNAQFTLCLRNKSIKVRYALLIMASTGQTSQLVTGHVLATYIG